MTASTTPLGHTSVPRTYVIDPDWVRSFRRAIPTLAEKSASPADRAIPLTFPIVLQPNPIPGLNLPESGVIHGEQRFHYCTPLRLGETVTVVAEVSSYKERGGTVFATLITRGMHADGTAAFEAQALLLYPVSDTPRSPATPPDSDGAP